MEVTICGLETGLAGTMAAVFDEEARLAQWDPTSQLVPPGQRCKTLIWVTGSRVGSHNRERSWTLNVGGLETLLLAWRPSTCVYLSSAILDWPRGEVPAHREIYAQHKQAGELLVERWARRSHRRFGLVLRIGLTDTPYVAKVRDHDPLYPEVALKRQPGGIIAPAEAARTVAELLTEHSSGPRRFVGATLWAPGDLRIHPAENG